MVKGIVFFFPHQKAGREPVDPGAGSNKVVLRYIKALMQPTTTILEIHTSDYQKHKRRCQQECASSQTLGRILPSISQFLVTPGIPWFMSGSYLFKFPPVTSQVPPTLPSSYFCPLLSLVRTHLSLDYGLYLIRVNISQDLSANRLLIQYNPLCRGITVLKAALLKP